MKYKLLFLMCLLVAVHTANAQKQDSARSETEAGKLYLSALPVIAANPAFGFIYGAAGSAGIFLGDPSGTSMSSAMVTATYSTKKQLMFTFKSTAYTKSNDWMLMGDWRLFFSSQPTYGLGTGPSSIDLTNTRVQFDENDSGENEEGEMMDFNLVRFHQTALKQVKPNFYLGIGYHLDVHFDIYDHLLDLEADPPVLTSHYTYSMDNGFDPEKYATSGLSANVVYDSRDNVANPYEGRFAFASFRVVPTFLGSTKNATTLWLEYRDYFSLQKNNPRHLIGIWVYTSLTTSGTLPYMNLPALGWDQMGRSGRAYPQGRFRGYNLVYAEVEWRFPVPVFAKNPDLLGGVVFASATTASDKSADVRLFQYLKPAAGIGLRVMIQKKSRTNLNLDYGWGADGAGALYLNLNESF